MKLNKEDSSLEMNSNEKNTDDISNGDTQMIEGTADKYDCPKCRTHMVSFQDNSVQCELLTETKAGPFLEIIDKIKNGIRPGSAQNVTEVMEEVPYDKSVVTIDQDPAPDETVLVTRSFENQAVPQESRRSSIAVIVDAIKALGARLTPETLKTRRSEVEDVERNYDNELGHSSHSQDQLQALCGEDCQLVGKNAQRKSFQLDNGTVVEEESAEYDADKAISTDDNLALGDVNFISRSFETVQENLPGRKESLIDKINPLKLIEKMRRGSQALVQNNENKEEKSEDEDKPLVASSGIRRKSLLPALLLDSNMEEEGTDVRDEESEIIDECARDTKLETANDDELLRMSPVRFVTTGVRRGSVAAVSGAPPCRQQAEDSRQEHASLPSSENSQEDVRFITQGIRKGSVAMVSATPPCHCLDEEKATERGSQITNAELHVDGEDCLLSGVRRRSLGLINEGSRSATTSPAREKRVSFGTTSENWISKNDDSESERERKSSDAADEFMNRVTQRYTGKEAETKKRKKGAVSLFEELTGREIGVDYSTIDAKKIQEKLDAEFDEKHRTAPRLSIPVITFTEDKSDNEDIQAKEEGTGVIDDELHNDKKKSEGEGRSVDCSQDSEHDV